MSLAVLNTPKWTAEQALLGAQNLPDVEMAFVVTCDKNGQWDSITGGKHKTGDLLLAAEVLRRRAFQSMGDWYR